MSENASLFVQITNIKGSVTDKKYSEWIAIDSAQLGVGNYARVGNNDNQLQGATPSFHPVVIQKELDISSTPLFMAVTQGTKVDKIIIAKVVNTTDDRREVIRWVCTDCYINSYNIAVGGDASVPHEETSFSYGSITQETNMHTADGKSAKQGPNGWDLIHNERM